MSDLPAPPRFVALLDGRPLDILPPSWELSEALSDLRGKPQGESHETAVAIMNLVVRHCLGVKDMTVVGGPLRWAGITRAIVATWPDDGPWPYWSEVVAHCVSVFTDAFQAPLLNADPSSLRIMETAKLASPLRALDPERVTDALRRNGRAAAESWLSPAPPEPATAAAPKPREGDTIDFAALASALRKARKPIQAALVEHMADKTEATVDEIAHKVHGDPMATEKTIRNRANETNKSLEDMGAPVRFRLASSRMYREILSE